MPSPELIAAVYPWVLPLHIGLVTVSVGLFLLRGLGVLAGQRWPLSAWARTLAPSIDTLLLIAGCTLWWLLQLNPLHDRWLGVKLVLLVVYIVLGSMALKRAPSRSGKALFFAAALAVAAYMISAALRHHPLGMFAP